MKRITTAGVDTAILGRQVRVVFKSPYRWRVYENGQDVTKSLGFALRGPSLPPHSDQWEAFHAEVSANERRCVLAVVY